MRTLQGPTVPSPAGPATGSATTRSLLMSNRPPAALADTKDMHQFVVAGNSAALPPGAPAALPTDRLGGLRVTMHPSLCVIRSAHPIYSIWHINQDPERFVPV